MTLAWLPLRRPLSGAVGVVGVVVGVGSVWVNPETLGGVGSVWVEP